jgi:hypothetical protein
MLTGCTLEAVSSHEAGCRVWLTGSWVSGRARIATATSRFMAIASLRRWRRSPAWAMRSTLVGGPSRAGHGMPVGRSASDAVRYLRSWAPGGSRRGWFEYPRGLWGAAESAATWWAVVRSSCSRVPQGLRVARCRPAGRIAAGVTAVPVASRGDFAYDVTRPTSRNRKLTEVRASAMRWIGRLQGHG